LVDLKNILVKVKFRVQAIKIQTNMVYCVHRTRLNIYYFTR